MAGAFQITFHGNESQPISNGDMSAPISQEVNANTDNAEIIGIHAVWSGVVGTPDGVITFQQSNDGTKWTSDGLTAQIDVDAVADNGFATLTGFGGNFLRIRYLNNSITAGSLNVYVKCKGITE